jgi:hypothetical protein
MYMLFTNEHDAYQKKCGDVSTIVNTAVHDGGDMYLYIKVFKKETVAISSYVSS